jgi:hypothetical protein
MDFRKKAARKAAFFLDIRRAISCRFCLMGTIKPFKNIGKSRWKVGR